jgi:hypothetical protein
MSVSNPEDKIEWGGDSEPRKNERVPSYSNIYTILGPSLPPPPLAPGLRCAPPPLQGTDTGCTQTPLSYIFYVTDGNIMYLTDASRFLICCVIQHYAPVVWWGGVEEQMHNVDYVPGP